MSFAPGWRGTDVLTREHEDRMGMNLYNDPLREGFLLKSMQMKTIKTVEIKPVFVEYIPKEMEEGVVYISEAYSVSIHKCLCGCGVDTVLPLSSGMWTLIKNGNKISFTPSIANYQFPCKSHYIITDNKANFV